MAKKQCGTCGGNGKITCYPCNGTGTRTGYNDKSCNTCGGNGDKTCNTCHGSGLVDSNKGCFITSATLTALNKGDDCMELNAFRRFRDTYVAKNQIMSHC